MAMAMVRVYEDAAVNLAAMPVIAGRKSRLESFAGADTTYTIEAMMGDCRALQARRRRSLSSDLLLPHTQSDPTATMSR
jgi:prolyl-tRNA synthetase